MWSHSPMRRIAVTNAAISNHSDDNVDLHYHCNAFMPLFSVFGLPSIKDHIFQRTPLNTLASKYSTSNTEDKRNLNYVYCLNVASVEKVWFLVPLEHSHDGKGIMVPMKYIFMVYSPKDKDRFHKRFFFEVVMVMLKEKRKHNKKIQCQ